MTKPSYSCSQSSLYATCRIMWTNYVAHQAAMAGFKLKYTLVYGEDALEAITAAQMLPDDQTRGSAAENAKYMLETNYGPDALLKWQMLRSYIEEAYGDSAKPFLEAAGWLLYTKASGKNWEKLGEMMAKGLAFLQVAANVTALTGSNDNMPPTFVAEFGASKTAFDTQYLVFKNNQSGQPVGTADKIEANNAVHKTAMGLSKDADLKFRDNPEVAGMLNFTEVLRLVDGHTGGGTLTFKGVLDVNQRISLAVPGIRESSEVVVKLGGNLAAVVGVWLDVDDSSAHDIVLPVQNGSLTKTYTYAQLLKPGVVLPEVLKLQNTAELQVVDYKVDVTL